MTNMIDLVFNTSDNNNSQPSSSSAAVSSSSAAAAAAAANASFTNSMVDSTAGMTKIKYFNWWKMWPTPNYSFSIFNYCCHIKHIAIVWFRIIWPQLWIDHHWIGIRISGQHVTKSIARPGYHNHSYKCSHHNRPNAFIDYWHATNDGQQWLLNFCISCF